MLYILISRIMDAIDDVILSFGVLNMIIFRLFGVYAYCLLADIFIYANFYSYKDRFPFPNHKNKHFMNTEL